MSHTETAEAPGYTLTWWGKFVATLIAGFLMVGVIAGTLWFTSWVIRTNWISFFELQRENYAFCIERGGTVSIGPFGGVTCDGLKR